MKSSFRELHMLYTDSLKWYDIGITKPWEAQI